MIGILLITGFSIKAQYEKRYFGIEIDGVLCGYTTSEVIHTEYLGKEVLEVHDSVHLMLMALGQDINTDIVNRYILDPNTYEVILNEAVYSSSDVGKILEASTEVFGDYAIHKEVNSGILDTAWLTDGLIIDNPINTPYLLEDFAIEGNRENSYQIYDLFRGVNTKQKFTLEGKEDIHLAGKNYTCFVFKIFNEHLGTNTRIWVDTKDATTLRFEIMNRNIYLAESSVIKQITTVDMDNSIFAKVDQRIANFMDMTYLKVKADIQSSGEFITVESLNFPGQKFEGSVEENHIQGIFELEPVRYEGKNAPSFPADYSSEEKLKKYLEAEILVESDHPDIIAMAAEITDEATDSWDATIRLSEWVGKEIRGAVPGGTSAINTLRTREGECGSHSRLLAALCRAAGIPSRMVIGCLYSPWYGGSFGQHAWTEVYMGSETGWVAVDATILEFDYVDAGHIKLGELTTFLPNSMEILEYTVSGGEVTSEVPKKYQSLLGPYINKEKWNVLEVLFEDGSLTVDIMGRMKLALHEEDEEGRMYAKLTDKVYFTFPEGDMHIVENSFAMKQADAEIIIAEYTPSEFVPYIGPYMIFQAQLKFEVIWENGLSIIAPNEEKPHKLTQIGEDRWIDSLDHREYVFKNNSDGSIAGMDIFTEVVLQAGANAYWIVNKAIEEDGLEAARSKFRELWNNRALDLQKTEGDMNQLGHKYLGEERFEEALMVFELNVETFPDSWNAYDSYGESLMKNGNTDLAIENYEKSLEMNPDNEGAKQMLEKLYSQETE